MEAAFMSCWEVFASGFGKISVLPFEWFYQREVEGALWDYIKGEVVKPILHPILGPIDEIINWVYDIISCEGAIIPLDPQYLAECLRIIGA
jgi:hypothetical protein